MEFNFLVHLHQVGQYQILRTLGKGGMGEVFLVYDPVCDREVALKLMRPEWKYKPALQERFLKEARTAARLSHPSIIPIHSIHSGEGESFYTMPNIEGETLKTILRTPLHPIRASIPSLMRIFLNICSAIAYTHAKNIVHRDLKPENIIIGKYGEVILVDWGLAELLGDSQNRGKGEIPGTLTYMAPELAFGRSASPQTDIYALGVILYQMLALRLPFHRSSLKEFRRSFLHETILDPQEIAPDRDIALLLSQMTKKCLYIHPEERYQTVEDLIVDVEQYIEGLPEWGEPIFLHIDLKEDWEFQENVALGRHMAINREAELLEWVNLMISKKTFPGNLKIELDVELGATSQGLGLLFSIPDSRTRKSFNEGYCLWLVPDSGELQEQSSRLYRSGVEVWRDSALSLLRKERYQLRIEKIESQINFYVNGTLKMRFHSHIPISGNQIGLLLRDDDVTIYSFAVALASQYATVNCLAIPDAFVARKNYEEALIEYRKIAHSFSGRAEGREATFRAGLTLLEEAKQVRVKQAQEKLLGQALEEFGKLRATPGAPLEYVGKALVYNACGEIKEEAKCLELALRKFSSHPLRPIVAEHLISRLYASSQNNRVATYYLSFIVLRYLPDFLQSPAGQELLTLLEKNLEPLPFFFPSSDRKLHMAIQLAFWLGRPLALSELLENKLSPSDTDNALFALVQLKQKELVQSKASAREDILWLLGKAPMPSSISPQARIVKFDCSLRLPKTDFSFLDAEDTILLPYKIWALLLESRWKKAKALLDSVPNELLTCESHPFFFLHGCLLLALNRRDEGLSHLLNVSESRTPPTSALLSHYLLGNITPKRKWWQHAFFWEKYKLLEQIQLFTHCAGEKESNLRARLARLSIK